MFTDTTTAQRLAIVAGVVATIAALAILSADAITSGHWSLAHLLMPAVVSITILCGHLFHVAAKSWKFGSATGFAVLFLLGTAITVYTSVGRQTATADHAMAQAEASNRELATKTAELADAKARWAHADGMATKEMTGQKCLERCKAWKTRADDIQARIGIIEAGIRRIGGEQIVAPSAEMMAKALALAGFDKAAAKHAAITLEPFANSLFFEFTAIIAFGFGFSGHRKAPRVVITPEPGPVGTPDVSQQERRAAVVSFAAAHAARKGGMPTLAEVQAMHAARFGSKLPKSTASRWRQEAAAVQPVKRLRVVG